MMTGIPNGQRVAVFVKEGQLLVSRTAHMERMRATSHSTLNTGPEFPAFGLAKIAFEIPSVSANVIHTCDNLLERVLLDYNARFFCG
jgi:hypothetical protein